MRCDGRGKAVGAEGVAANPLTFPRLPDSNRLRADELERGAQCDPPDWHREGPPHTPRRFAPARRDSEAAQAGQHVFGVLSCLRTFLRGGNDLGCSGLPLSVGLREPFSFGSPLAVSAASFLEAFLACGAA